MPKVARACGCPPTLELGYVPKVRSSVRYLELTAPVAIPANREMRGHLEATTVRAFLVSVGFPSACNSEEAHHHCRKCGRVPLQSKADKAGSMLLAGRWSTYRAVERVHGTSVSTNWDRTHSHPPFVLRSQAGALRFRRDRP